MVVEVEVGVTVQGGRDVDRVRQLLALAQTKSRFAKRQALPELLVHVDMTRRRVVGQVMQFHNA